MYKIIKGHEGIEWIKPPRLRSYLELEGPTKGEKGNSRRIQSHGTGRDFFIQ